MLGNHALLKRQIARYLACSDILPESLGKLLSAVSDAYNDFDASRKILERAVELSSAELFHANSELRGVLKALPDLLFRMDAAGRIFELTEHTPGRPQIPFRVAGDAAEDGGHPTALASAFTLAALDVRASKLPVSFEYADSSDTDERFYEVRLLPFADGELIGVVRDVTLRKRAEIALKISEETARAIQAELLVAKTDLEAEREKLQRMATRDSLTGIWNRRGIFDILSAELIRARRERRPLALAMVDLDWFKRINDEYGHPTGDSVLTQVVHRIEFLIRASDHIGRYGGEEFIVVMPECNLENAAERIEHVRRAIEQDAIQLPEGDLHITCSFGITWTGGDKYDIHELVREADAALYRAKQGGRNRVVTEGILEYLDAAA
jgi:diguanylate cyclase (GGDEF)-like protein